MKKSSLLKMKYPLPSHYNKNKHSLRGSIYASGAMLILYQSKKHFGKQ